MQESFLRFSQVQETDVAFKQWATIVEDAKQLFENSRLLGVEEFYVLDVEPYSLLNPRAGVIHDMYDHVIDMHLQIGIAQPLILTEHPSWQEFNPPLYHSKNFFHIHHTGLLPETIDFTLVTDSQQTLENVVDRFAISSFNKGENELSIHNNEYEPLVTPYYRGIQPVNFLC